MRNKTHLWKRSLAAFLSFVMLLGMFPALGGRVAVEAEAAPKNSEGEELSAESYITLPITIRDFAADGMLFEYNEVNLKGITGITLDTDNVGYSCNIDPTYIDPTAGDYTGIRVFSYTEYPTALPTYQDGNTFTGAWWICLLIDAYGNVLKVLPSTEDAKDYAAAMEPTYDNGAGSTAYPAYSVWAWGANENAEARDLLAQITDTNKFNYRIGLDTTNNQIYVGNRFHYNSAWDLGTGNYTGLRYFQDVVTTTTDTDGTTTTVTTKYPTFDASNDGNAWHCIICDENGFIIEVLPSGTAKVNTTGDNAYTSGPYFDAMPEGGFSIWAWSGSAQYEIISSITNANKGTYQFTFFDSSLGNSVLYIDKAKVFHNADTQAFGLLATDANDYINNLNEEAGTMSTIIGGSVLFANGSWDSKTEPDAVTSNLYSSTDRDNPYATQLIHGARVRTNLVDMMLDEDYKPIYTPETVTFLAKFMQEIMAVPEQNADGSYNTFHVGGIKMFAAASTDEDGNLIIDAEGRLTYEYLGPNDPNAVYDLADLLRLSVNENFDSEDDDEEKLGTYTASQEKFLGNGLRTFRDVKTWFDAAYFLLHNTWRDSAIEAFFGREGHDGYGMRIPRYDRIHLVETTNEAGEKCYVFNARYDDSVYDWSNGEIYNTQFTEYTQASNRAGNLAYAYGNKLPVSRFDPLGPSALGVEIQQGLGYGMSGNTYGDMTGASETQDWDEYYDETNYNMTLEGHAQFTYHHDSNQYFTFTGDDDVYLYINGVRVLDIGGAHSISKVSINMNDVAEVCKLEDGGTYRFDFFFMERHGTAANFGIETNIQVVDPSMTTHKTGYQNGVSTGYNGYVDPEIPVVYDFAIENKSDVVLHDLTFDDAMIGVSLNKDKITLNSETKITDLSVTHYDANGEVDEFIAVGDLTEAKLQAMLETGLKGGEQIVIYGFTYTIPADKWQYRTDSEDNRISNDYFYNLLSTTAKDSLDKEVIGTDHWVVQKMDFTFEGFHIYEWAGHGVTLEVEDMLIPLKNAIAKKNAENKILDPTAAEFELVATKVDVAVTADPDGAVNAKAVAGVNDDNKPIITYTGTETGKDVFYYAISANIKYGEKTPTLTAIVPVTVYSYDVADNTYVLDYGLSVELNGDEFGMLVNDTLSLDEEVNPNTTVSAFLGIGNAAVATDADGQPVTVTATDPVLGKEYTKNVYAVSGDMAEIDEETGTATVVKTYGDFVYTVDEESVKYNPTDIIDNTDTIAAYVQVMEEDAEELTKFTGVVMYEFVTTAPASVVYYEENHPGITYVSEGENQWVHYETIDPETGESLAGTEQSADPDQNYGSDEWYEYDISGDIYTDGENWTPGDVIESITMKLDDTDLDAFQDSVIEALNNYLGYSGSDSNGTVNILEVKETADVMYFDFVGTGFEIISRTTNEQYAVLNVTVFELDDDGNIIQVQKKNTKGELVFDDEGNPVMINKIAGMRAVITESKGGDLYQVPIVSVTGLTHGNYRVSVKAAGSSAAKTRVLYIDGIRIYGPLSDGQALEYYNPAEYMAEVMEIKELIADRKLTFIGVNEDDEENVYLTDGTTSIENITPDPESGDIVGVLVEEESSNHYMQFGPNNELYLDGNALANVIVLILKPIKTQNGVDYPDAARTVQIGAHRKLNDSSSSNGTVYMTYGTNAEMIMYGENAEGESTEIEVNTGTEMYYTIELDKLTPDASGNYLLFLGTNGSLLEDTTLALTNFKIAGYTVELANIALSLPDDDETDDETTAQTRSTIPTEAYAFYAARKALFEASNEAEAPKVNENLEITAATLKATSVARNKSATLTVKAGSEALNIVVTDEDGNEVTATRVVRKVSGSTVTFTFIWKITGTKGEVQKYTIRVYDANDLASVNEKTVTVTVK